ncbi:MAG: hypothetical protein D6731_16130 [Planctomycetota bacterium]|nr:MAG: hypothetical protein D6731_16130 [Planctomycetota bacterium]
MSATVRAWAHAQEAPRELEDRFAGRWDAKRAIHADLRPLVEAVAQATAAAGWWKEGAEVDAGLVVGVDLGGWGHALRFGEALAARGGQNPPPPLRPSLFLASLPSTPAATLGLLFGFPRCQATVNRLGLSGFAGIGYALDAIALERCERWVVAASTVVDRTLAARWGAAFADAPLPFRLATALCLEAGADLPRLARAEAEPPSGAEDPTLTTGLLEDLPASYRGLSAPSLLALGRALEGGRQLLVHREPCWRETAALAVEGTG